MRDALSRSLTYSADIFAAVERARVRDRSGEAIATTQIGATEGKSPAPRSGETPNV